MGEKMTTRITSKSDEITSLVEEVTRSPLGAEVLPVDHWEADPHAIGFRRVRGERTLYVSSWKQAEGTFFWALETASGETVDEGYVARSDLIDLVRTQLLTRP